MQPFSSNISAQVATHRLHPRHQRRRLLQQLLGLRRAADVLRAARQQQLDSHRALVPTPQEHLQGQDGRAGGWAGTGEVFLLIVFFSNARLAFPKLPAPSTPRMVMLSKETSQGCSRAAEPQLRGATLLPPERWPEPAPCRRWGQSLPLCKTSFYMCAMRAVAGTLR